MISRCFRQVHRRARCFAAALLLSFVVVSSNSALAATFTWNGGGGNANWGTAGNWTGGIPANANTTDLIFAGTTNTGTAGTPLNNNIASPMLLNSITFSSGGTPFFLGGSNIRFDGGTTNSITQNSSSAESIANGISAPTSNNTQSVTLTGNGTGIVTLSGIIASGTGQRDIAIVKTGTSTFLLSGNNTYGSGTTINQGTILIGNNNALGTGSVSLGDTAAVANNASLLTNGAFTIGNAITVRSGNTGVATLGGNTDNNSTFSGAITLNHDLTISQVANAGANALSITGGIAGGIAGTKTVTFAGPGNINVSTTGISNGTGTTAVAVSGGVTSLNVANSYTGTTTVNGGTLLVNGSTAAGSAVTVNSGGTLGGTGTVNGTVTVNGTGIIDAGPKGTPGTLASVGKLTIANATAGALTLASTSTFHADAFGIAAANWDQLVVAGTAALGSAQFSLSIATAGLNFATGATYIVIDAGTITGQFSGLTEGAIVTSNGYNFTAHYDTANGNFDLIAIPEPSTWVAAALTLLAIGYTQRRKLTSALRTIPVRLSKP